MRQEIFIQWVELQLGRRSVNMEDRFYEDLDATSIDMLNLVVRIEKNTGIFIPEETIPELKTVEELYRFIQSHESINHG
jgi:acyl carrier protein